MSKDSFEESRDNELGRALDDALPKPPLHEVDWSALHARITASAAPLLHQETVPSNPLQPAAWWQPLAQLSPRGIPLAAAASALLMLGAAWLGTAQPAAGNAAFVMIEEEFVNGVAYEARPLLAGVESTDMLDVVLFADGEDW